MGRALDAALPRATAEAAARRARRSTTSSPCCGLRDVLDLVRAGSLEQGREIGVVLEIKHATYFAGLGLGSRRPDRGRTAATPDGPRGELPLTIEAFESTVLQQLQERGIRGDVRLSARGRGAPVRPRRGARAGRAHLQGRPRAPAGLDRLVGVVDGISVDKRMILAPDKLGRMTGPSPVIADAHARGLRVYTWTCRPENAFLVGQYPRPRRHGGIRRLRGGVGRDPGCRCRRRLRRSSRPRGGVLPRLIASP